MARIEGDLVINRPVEEAFDFVADERNEPCYNPRIRRAEQLSPGPIGRGTRFGAEARTRSRTVPMVIEITAYERPRRLACRFPWPLRTSREANDSILFPVGPGWAGRGRCGRAGSTGS
jgi:Polyketide cyclase / dehydrase and lipid transport